MPLAGGAADKAGNRYERRWTVLAMLELLFSRADTLRVEVPGENGDGAEFRVKAGSTVIWTQTKRQTSRGVWTVALLLKEHFLQGWLDKLRSGEQCIFASTSSADQLRELCDNARDAVDIVEYEAEFLKSGRQKHFEALKKAWGNISSGEALQLLRLIEVETADEKNLNRQIDRSLQILVHGNPQAARNVLMQYADEVIHKVIAASDVWSHLKDNGIEPARNIITTPAPDQAVGDLKWLQDQLHQLPPILHNHLREAMKADSVGARRLISSLTGEAPPTLAMLEWQDSPPTWLAEADWRTRLAAAELANAYGAPKLQIDLLVGLAEEGFPPRHLWLAKAAFPLTALGEVERRSEMLAMFGSCANSQHPYARAIAALFDSRLADAERLVTEWDPTEPADQVARAILSIQIALGLPGQTPTPEALADALTIAEAQLRRGWVAGVAMWRANALVLQARQRGTKIYFSDLREAQELALRARDERRRWRGDSATPTALACFAAGIRGDVDFVMRTGLPVEMGGNATDHEANSSEVSEQVALAALQLGRFDLASDAASRVTGPFERKRIEALMAQLQRSDSAPLWREAIDLAADNYEYLAQALAGLARTGPDDLPRLDELSQQHQQLAYEIRATADLASGNTTQSIAALRTQRRESLTAAMALSEGYISLNDIDSAVQTLLDAAADFNDPQMRFQAAITLSRAGRAAEAEAVLGVLIADRDEDWPDYLEVLKLAAQLALDVPDLVKAARYSRQIVKTKPDDVSSRWALVHTLMLLDDLPGAWTVMSEAPSAMEPTTRSQGEMWTHLHRRYSDPATTFRGCLELLRTYGDDEEFASFTLMSLMMHRESEDPLPADLLGAYHEQLELFFTRWPDSAYLHRIRADADDDDDLIKALTASIRPTPERLAERNRLTREFYRAEKPLIVLAQYTGRSYCEIIVRRATGVLPAAHPNPREGEVCLATVSAASNADVAIDATGIAVLAALPAAVRDAAMSIFRRVITTEEVARDAREYEEHLQRDVGTLYYNAEADAPGLSELSDAEKEGFKRSLQGIQSLLASLPRQPIQPDPSHRRLRFGVQSSVLHLAASGRTAVWCDDAAARVLIRNFGIATFSTIAVIEYLLAQGLIVRADYEQALESLIRERIGNPPVSLSRLIKIAREEQWEPNSAAAALAHPHAWARPQEMAVGLASLLKACQRERPDRVPAWLNNAVFGAALSSNTTRVAVDVTAALLAGMLVALGACGELASLMVEATRAGLKSALPVDNPAGIPTDPLPAAVEKLRQLMLKSGVAPRSVFPKILDCLANLSPEDSLIVASALLAADPQQQGQLP